MGDQASDTPVEARLRVFLAGELHRAELDYPQMVVVGPSGLRSRRAFVMSALALGVVAAIVLIRPWAGLPASSTGGVPSQWV
jgi:hypothetical protein